MEDRITWGCHTKVEKYDDDGKLLDVIEVEGNLLLTGGASALWERLIGTGVTAFDATNAFLGVGNSSTAEATTQTTLQGGASTLLKGMDATYPQHSDSTSVVGAKSIVYKATFGSSDANFAWNEWGIFNAASGGRMLNRKVESLGTKATGTWVLTVTLSLA